jgi:hypothetical protein
MVPFAAIEQATLLGIAAVLTAIGGLASTILALRKNRSEEHETCLLHLKEAREESERLAEELHRLKMERENET